MYEMNPLSKKHYRIAIILAGSCLLLLMLFIIFYPTGGMAGYDPVAYTRLAQGIVTGRGFQSTIEPWVADRPPLYPYFLALTMFFVDFRPDLIFSLQAAFLAVAAGLFYLTAVRVIGEKRALVAGIIFCCLPHFYLFTKQVLTESPYVAMLVFLMASVLLPQVYKNKHVVLTGVILGLMILLRREAMLIGGGMLIGLLLYRFGRQWKDLLVKAIITAGLAVMVVSPWVIRNYLVLGVPVLSSASGLNLGVCNNPDATGSYTAIPVAWMQSLPDVPSIRVNTEDDLAQVKNCFMGNHYLRKDSADFGREYFCFYEIELLHNELLGQQVKTWLLQNPLEFLRLLPLKAKAYFGLAGSLPFDAADLILLPFCFLGLFNIFKHKNYGLLLMTVLLLAISFAVALGFCGGFRYRIIIYPGMILLAAYGVPDIFFKLSNRTKQWVCKRCKCKRSLGLSYKNGEK